MERRPPAFQPRFMLTLLYLLGFFVLYSFALVLPELLDVLGEVPPGPEQEEIAKQVARQAARPRLLPAFVLALLTIGVGGYYKLLPGFRSP